MADELVTVATYQFAAKAEVARWALEQEGVRAYVADDNIVTADWFLGNAVGYIKLQVASSDIEKVREVFERKPDLRDVGGFAKGDDGEDDGPLACLACGEVMPDDADRCPACGWSFGDAAEGEE